MFQVGDYVVYKREVCKIREMKENHYSNQDYFILCPVDDESLVIDIPTDNRSGFLRPLMTSKEAEALIARIPEIESIETTERMLENEYRFLMQSNKMEDLIKIIKTTYLRNNERKLNGRKISDKDNSYFENAERMLYNELAISLNIPKEDVKNYIIDKVSPLSNLS